MGNSILTTKFQHTQYLRPCDVTSSNGTQNTPKRPDVNNFLMKWNERLNHDMKTNCHMRNSMIELKIKVFQYLDQHVTSHGTARA